MFFKFGTVTLVFSIILVAFAHNGEEDWSGSEVEDLINEYYNIFPNGNRNAASHRWATFILDRSSNFDKETFELMFSGFCPVSGSPISYPSSYNLWKMNLPLAESEEMMEGGIYFCCSPCVCDTNDFIHIDTLTVHLSDGYYEFNFLVLGDPCAMEGGEDLIPSSAPDATCDGAGLEMATYSDLGYVIIGLYQDLPATGFQDSAVHEASCQARADAGYTSGMGTIFRDVASINPVPHTPTNSTHSLADSGLSAESHSAENDDHDTHADAEASAKNFGHAFVFLILSLIIV